MKFEQELLALECEIEEIKKQAISLKEDYENAKEFTSIFLQCCEKHGIKAVSINTLTDLIESCKGWGDFFPESIFADEREGTWPAIWKVSDEMQLGSGCGNSGQHQADCTRLIEGVFKFKDGKWEKIQ